MPGKKTTKPARTESAPELEASTKLPWTRAQRNLLHGPLHPHPLDPRRPRHGADEAWRLLRDAVNEPGLGPRERAAEIDGSAPAIRDAMRAMRSAFDTGDLGARLDPVVELARSVSVRPMSDDAEYERRASLLVDLWVGREGVAFVLDMFFRGLPYAPSGHGGTGIQDYWTLCSPQSEAFDRVSIRRMQFMAPLRRHVIALDPAAHAVARVAAESQRRSGTLEDRVHLAFLFPTEPEWAAAAARELLATPVDDCPVQPLLLLASLRDGDLALTLAKDYQGWPLLEHHFDAVDVMGADAGPALLEMLTKAATARTPERRGWAAALALADPALARASLGALPEVCKKELAKVLP